MHRATRPDVTLEIWLPFESNNGDGKQLSAPQLRLALPQAGHSDRRTEAQDGTRSPVKPSVRSKPRPPSRCTLHITPRDVLTIFRVGEHPDWLTRLQTGSIDSSGTRVHASLRTREARIPVWSHSC
ncbi:hypothetical protein BDV32DRAFT_142779 [Aspergillus pseudonomiae]|nr:hypothetical protein BDV32DRAFT_142779 [Aspergillus pseudonomiae]